ncbi:MAG: hypothetical protein I8H66_05575 [Sphingobacteriia bacterium]|nr:hypothetical protein [Sphingobacteriia bacterium]
MTKAGSLRNGNTLSQRSVFIWRMVQLLVWLIGLCIFLLLIFDPPLGLLILWNILIPVAPALLVVAAGLWRNICPLATTVLLPRHLNLSNKKKMSPLLQSKLQLVAIIALYLIVPVRHALFNTNGMATAALLTVAAVTGILMGFRYDWKSGWCSSLCPVHPVEKLYGSRIIASLPNAHCDRCVKCSVPCPDTTPGFHPAITRKNSYQTWSGLLTIGGLPGFIWGWFQVPDHTGATSLTLLLDAYAYPFFGFLGSLLLFVLLKRLIGQQQERVLISFFAAAGVSCYYWFRIPALLGFNHLEKDGLLLDMRGVLPEWSILSMTILSTLFFFWWLVFRKSGHRSWVLRPVYV